MATWISDLGLSLTGFNFNFSPNSETESLHQLAVTAAQPVNWSMSLESGSMRQNGWKMSIKVNNYVCLEIIKKNKKIKSTLIHSEFQH